jgi:hypothetical protein
MFEHFFDANLPFAGLVDCHWSMPLHGLAATGPFREKSCFGLWYLILKELVIVIAIRSCGGLGLGTSLEAGCGSWELQCQ